METRSKTVFGENAGAGAAGKAKATTSGRHFGTQLSTNQQQVAHRGVDMKMKKSTAVPLATRRAAPVAAPEPVHPRQFIEQIHPADINDLESTQCAVDYVDDIYKYWKQCEHAYAINPNYMETQSDINARMRAILLDWLVEVHLKFKLVPQTLYLTVQLIDRFLELKVVKRQKLQLVGVTAMLIASKYEEIYAPEVRDFEYISDKAYPQEEIIKMESFMLEALQFRVSVPTTLNFLQRFCKVTNAATKVKQLANYYSERMLQEYEMLQFSPSMLACAALSCARRAVHKTPWNPTLAQYTGYDEAALLPCVRRMIQLMDPQHIQAAGKKNSLRAVSKKFSSSKCAAVAKMEFPELPSM